MMNKSLTTHQILTLDDVVRFQAGDSTEPLVDIRAYDDSIITEYIKKDMLDYTGNTVYVRDTLAKKLASIDAKLAAEGYKLKVVYGYRHPEVQEKYFTARRQALANEFSSLDDKALDKLTHSFVAIPSVAGHPAGAAVDLTIINKNGKEVDMGGKIADYATPERIPTDADGLSNEQIEHRKLLHDAMIAEGFAPFYGEWWHFSYGDREWAAFYNKKALYGAVDFRTK